MDKTMSTMLMTLVFANAAKALRDPGKLPQEGRDALARILEDMCGQTKGMLTGELMEDAVRDVKKEGA